MSIPDPVTNGYFSINKQLQKYTTDQILATVELNLSMVDDTGELLKKDK